MQKQENNNEQNPRHPRAVSRKSMLFSPSTTMNPVISDARSKDRRWVRCHQVFCRIDVEDGEQPLRAVVGVRAK
jgi:hypothetical protein